MNLPSLDLQINDDFEVFLIFFEGFQTFFQEARLSGMLFLQSLMVLSRISMLN